MFALLVVERAMSGAYDELWVQTDDLSRKKGVSFTGEITLGLRLLQKPDTVSPSHTGKLLPPSSS